MSYHLSLVAPQTKFEFGNFVNWDPSFDVYPIAIDVGYSSVKVISPNGRFIFPALVTLLGSKQVYKFSDTDLRYMSTDHLNRVFYMGDKIRQLIAENDTTINEVKFFQRERIYAEEYLILFRTALFLGLLDQDRKLIKDKEVKVVTGLPEEYISQDERILREIIEKPHVYKVAIGEGDYQTVAIEIKDLEVISQPIGTYFAMVSDFNGYIRENFFSDNNVLIVDGGFHSIDTFLIRADNTLGKNKTWNHYAMYDVYTDTIQKIYDKTGVRLTINDLGLYITHFKHPFTIVYGRDRKEYNFKQDLLDSIQANAEMLINELMVTYNNFKDIHVLLLTGGTGKIYYPYFKDKVALRVELAETDGFSIEYTNVLGFYKYLIGTLS